MNFDTFVMRKKEEEQEREDNKVIMRSETSRGDKGKPCTFTK